MKEVTLTLNEQEALYIQNVLGELPTKTGAYMLVVKIAEQIKAQSTPDETK